jgi:hypothetical protein
VSVNEFRGNVEVGVTGEITRDLNRMLNDPLEDGDRVVERAFFGCCRGMLGSEATIGFGGWTCLSGDSKFKGWSIELLGGSMGIRSVKGSSSKILYSMTRERHAKSLSTQFIVS